MIVADERRFAWAEREYRELLLTLTYLRGLKKKRTPIPGPIRKAIDAAIRDRAARP